MWWKKKKKETPSFMIQDDRDVLKKIDYLVEEMLEDDTLFEMVKNYVEIAEDNPHGYTSYIQQLIEETISAKVDILKMLVRCVEKEKLLKEASGQSKRAM